MPFTNPQNNVVVPTGAQSGQSRIVIGPDVPAELQAFHPYGTSSVVTSAILFYDASPNTNTYMWIANVENPGGYLTVWWGSTTNGAIDPGGVVSEGGDGLEFGLSIRNTGSHHVEGLFHGKWGNDPTFGSKDDMLWFEKSDTTWPLIVASRVNTVDPNSGTVENWHAIAPQNGWTNLGGTFVPLRAKRVASPPQGVWLQGAVQPGASTANGTIIGSVSSLYTPTYVQRFPVYAFGGALNIVSETCAAEIDTAGKIVIRGDVNAANLFINTVYALD